MNEKENYLNELYNQIAEELGISATMMDKAIKSYNAVGSWLGECEPGLDVKIMPQGSVNLGTVNRPITDEDDYDIDLVCLLSNGSDLNAERIKNIVGDRLKEHGKYRDMLEEEGKRCWTLQYDEFHMDILPSVPSESEFIEPSKTGIRLTHKVEAKKYEDRYSNPYQYKLWFEKCMETILLEAKTDFAMRNKVEISTVSTYRVKTPLQKAIQLLKRHRDIMFQDEDAKDAPISIIITTLAAKSYQNESNLYEALKNIVAHMTDYIVIENGKYKILNPVMEEENFADKWNENPHKVECFKKWIEKVNNDVIYRPLSVVGTQRVSALIKESFGEGITNRAYNKIAENNKISREENHLYINGLQGGVSNKESVNSQPIMEHTFYGKR